MITDNIEELIKTKLPENNQIEGFIQADKEYKELIQLGLTKERGFSILTTEEIYIFSSDYIYCQSSK
jgi:hypothetical protein